MVKNAFTMIELIFAIVIISIVMLAIPAALTQTTSGIEETLKQEVIIYGAKEMGTILTHDWDENSRDKDSNITKILDVTNGDIELEREEAIFRRGNFNKKAERTFFQDITYASPIGLDGTEHNESEYDIDDYDNNTTTVRSSTNDFVININIHKKIRYVLDEADYSQATLSFIFDTIQRPASTNIKMIELNITDTKGKTILIMRSFACNIGTASLSSKDAK